MSDGTAGEEHGGFDGIGDTLVGDVSGGLFACRPVVSLVKRVLLGIPALSMPFSSFLFFFFLFSQDWTLFKVIYADVSVLPAYYKMLSG